ncbi:MAG: cation diffusion facilitator family transporter [Micropruina glycogenica]
MVGALVTNSLALLVDAAHMLTDAAGLGTALFAAHLARRPVSATRTWGYARAEVLSATGQAAVLLAVGVFVIIEGVQRLFAPQRSPQPACSYSALSDCWATRRPCSCWPRAATRTSTSARRSSKWSTTRWGRWP